VFFSQADREQVGDLQALNSDQRWGEDFGRLDVMVNQTPHRDGPHFQARNHRKDQYDKVLRQSQRALFFGTRRSAAKPESR